MIALAYPWLLLLALLPLLFLALRNRSQGEPVDAPVIPVGHWLSGMPGVSTHGRSTPRWRQLLLFLAWLSLVVAVARPQHVGEQIQMHQVAAADRHLDLAPVTAVFGLVEPGSGGGPAPACRGADPDAGQRPRPDAAGGHFPEYG